MIITYPRTAFHRMSRKQAITTCLALEDMRDRAIAALAKARQERDAALAEVERLTAIVTGAS